MPDQWHYTNNSQQYGPVTFAQLQQLAVAGRLQPTDLVWSYGKWIEARQVQGLVFAPPLAPPSPVPPPVVSVPAHSPQPTADLAAKAKSLAGAMVSRGKAAAVLVAKQAERTKLASVNLPGAFQTFGRHLHDTGYHRSHLPEHYQAVDTLLVEIHAVQTRAAGQPKAEGIAAKAKAVAKSAADTAQTKALQVRLNHALGELGKAAFDRFGDQAGPAELIRPITALRARMASLDAEIAELSKAAPGSFVTPKRIAVAGVACALLAALAVGWSSVRSGFNGTGWFGKGTRSWEQIGVLECDLRYPAANKSIAISPDGTLFAICGDEVPVNIGEVSSGKVISTIKSAGGENHSRFIDGRTLAFTPDNKCCIWQESTAICIWDIAGQRLQRKLPATGRVVLSPDQKTLAMGGSLTTLWDWTTGEKLAEFDGGDSIAFSPNGAILACKMPDGEPTIVREKAEDGHTVITQAPRDKHIALWDIQTRKQTTTLTVAADKAAGDVVSGLVFIDADTLAVALHGGLVRFYDVNKGAITRQLKFGLGQHKGIISAMTVSPDRKTLAVTGAVEEKVDTPDGKFYMPSGALVQLWDVPSGKVTRLKGHKEHLTGCAFSGDSKIIGTMCEESIRLWREQPGTRGKFVFVDPAEDEKAAKWEEEHGGGMEPSEWAKLNRPSPPITKAQFDQVQEGMSYDEVKKLLGGSGELKSDFETRDVDGGRFGVEYITRYTVRYEGKGSPGAHAVFFFKGKGNIVHLEQKTQSGLR